MIDVLGADALRFALLKTAPIGADVRFVEERKGFKGGDTDKAVKQFDACERGGGSFPQVEEGRNFATKIWNACNFRLVMGKDVGDLPEPEASDLSLYDIDILAKLGALEQSLENAYAGYRFSQIAEALSSFFWGDYCDWYLEAAKTALRGDDLKRKAAVLRTMDTVVARFLQQLHPFMPHLTEELWEKLEFGKPGKFLMQTPLGEFGFRPVTLEGVDAVATQQRVTAFYQAVGRARNLKAEYNLAATRVNFILAPNADWIEAEAPVFATLAGAATVSIQPSYEPPKGEPAALTDIGHLYMPLAGLVDIEAEKARLDKELEKVAKEVTRSESKLANENFVANAKPDVVQQERERLAGWKERQERLREMIASLG